MNAMTRQYNSRIMHNKLLIIVLFLLDLDQKNVIHLCLNGNLHHRFTVFPANLETANESVEVTIIR